MEYSVELHFGTAGLKDLEQHWRELEKTTALPFYCSFDWHSAWLEKLEPEPDKVIFVALLENDHIFGILPLSPPTDSLHLWRSRILEAPKRNGMDLAMPVIAAGKSIALWWPALRRALKPSVYSFFIIRFSGIPLIPDSEKMLKGLETKSVIRVQNHSCWFDCRQTAAEIRANYSSRLKKILRRGKRKLEDQGDLVFKSYTGMDAIEKAYPVFIKLESSGWKKESGTALALDHQAREFHEAFLFADSVQSHLRINLLHAGDQIVAGQLCVEYHGTISVLKIAYLQECSKASPGSVMLDQLLQQGCAEADIETISLVTGQPWMKDWHPHQHDVADIWLFSLGLGARLARLALELRDWLRLRRALE